MCKTEADFRNYFLVTHGSTNPRSLSQVQGLAQIVENQLGMTIGYGCLEGLELDLTSQIEKFIDRFSNCQKLVIMPLFLWAGQHTSIDIPTAIQKIRRDIPISIAPHLGSYPAIPQLLLDRYQQAERQFFGTSARLLIVHGSNYAPALEAMQTLANGLHARLGFGNSPATITESIDQLLAQAIDKIIILPYFLFAGKITDSIGEMIGSHGQAQQRVVYLPPPLTPDQIADLLSETIRQDLIKLDKN